MRTIAKTIIITMITALLVACQSNITNQIGRDDDAYLKSEAGKQLSIPEGLSKEQLHEYFMIPLLANQDSKQPSLEPPGQALAATLKSQQLDLQRKDLQITRDEDGIARMHMQLPFAQAWHIVDLGLQRAGYKISVADEKANIFYIADTPYKRTVTKETAIYQVKLHQASEAGTIVMVADIDGNTLAPNVQSKVLVLLRRAIVRSSRAVNRT